MAGLPSHLLMFLKKLSAYGYIYKLASSAFNPLFYCCSVNGKICLAEILSSKLDGPFILLRFYLFSVPICQKINRPISKQFKTFKKLMLAISDNFRASNSMLRSPLWSIIFLSFHMNTLCRQVSLMTIGSQSVRNWEVIET